MNEPAGPLAKALRSISTLPAFSLMKPLNLAFAPVTFEARNPRVLPSVYARRSVLAGGPPPPQVPLCDLNDSVVTDTWPSAFRSRTLVKPRSPVNLILPSYVPHLTLVLMGPQRLVSGFPFDWKLP